MFVNLYDLTGTKMTIRPRGRPRSFDRETAVRAAQKLIWQHGFEAMSLSQLEEAMGIRKSSLYSAFGSKLGLLKEAGDLYLADFVSQTAQLLSGVETATERLRAMFGQFATNFVESGGPLGCFLVSAAHSCSDDNADAVTMLMAQRQAFADLIRAEIEAGVAEGEFVRETPVAPLADFLVSVVHGMSIGARDGKSGDALRQMADFALSVLERYRSLAGERPGATNRLEHAGRATA